MTLAASGTPQEDEEASLVGGDERSLGRKRTRTPGASQGGSVTIARRTER